MPPSSENSSLTNGLGSILSPVTEDLKSVSVVIDDVMRAPTTKVRPMLDLVRRYRGKMLRPAFTILAGRCFGEVGRDHHHLGAIVELIHTATLVHDDILDSSDMRRREETVNRKWGNHAAVLLGDFLFATAFGLSANLDNPLASRYLAWTSGVVCQGEIMQIIETGNLDLREEDYMEIIEKKTAYLFAASARVGAEYVGAPKEAVDALADYGMRLGTAFQIIDDCLDLVGEEERVGKTLGTDARQGKVTLPVIHFLRTASEASTMRLRELLSGGEGDEHLEEIRALLIGNGSLKFARNRATQLAEESVERISTIPESEARGSFEALAHYTLLRNR
jgi:octaprenyl-diphosphate synthase